MMKRNHQIFVLNKFCSALIEIYVIYRCSAVCSDPVMDVSMKEPDDLKWTEPGVDTLKIR